MRVAGTWGRWLPLQSLAFFSLHATTGRTDSIGGAGRRKTMNPLAGGCGRKVGLVVALVIALVVGLVALLAGCGPSTGSGTSDGVGSSQGVAVAHACAFESRLEDHCVGASPASNWRPGCYDGPCPTWLDDHNLTYFDAEGNTCEEDSEYRNVVDVPTTCSEWMSMGEPLVHPRAIYCGASLLYNEFENGTGIETSARARRAFSAVVPGSTPSATPRMGPATSRLAAMT
jgi:hypothetical protein